MIIIPLLCQKQTHEVSCWSIITRYGTHEKRICKIVLCSCHMQTSVKLVNKWMSDLLSLKILKRRPVWGLIIRSYKCVLDYSMLWYNSCISRSNYIMAKYHCCYYIALFLPSCSPPTHNYYDKQSSHNIVCVPTRSWWHDTATYILEEKF